ncbi:MAG: hypothetical protein HKN88_10010 [Gammaproteobacteria bacterium]|nr:hypothetical protein [Gammaproteobacteria bacterium]NNC98390.1 hypothetical protein [Gammaproteobacteria bacterium]NNM13058.1 hypothetical protein [Gammaproteobacteria bacterium]
MGGFFKKLFGSKKKALRDADAGFRDADELWSEHETTDEILAEEFDLKPKKRFVETVEIQAMNEIPDSLPDLPDLPAPKKPSKPVIRDLDPLNIEAASDFTEKPSDPLDEVTRQIQAEIAAEKWQKEKLEKLRRLQEATDQFRRPDWPDDPLKKD